jgi:hypothetical protein
VDRGVLTLNCRYAFSGPAPLTLAEGNRGGVGKGLLLDCISVIDTGGPFAVASYTNDEAELAKHITAIAMNGEAAVQWDNVTDKFGNGTLNRALTKTDWEGRILGYSRTYKGPLMTVWFATANNAVIDKETVRRILHIKLETSLEHPDQRTGFKHPELIKWITKHRNELLAAALTMLSAYCLNGREDMKLKPWGSYEGWSDLVRNCIVWAGMPDPGKAREELLSEDSELVVVVKNLRALLKEVEAVKEGLTAAKIVGLAQHRHNEKEHRRELRAALEESLPEFDAPSLGRLLRDHCRQNIGGYFIDRVAQSRKANRWTVRRAEEM